MTFVELQTIEDFMTFEDIETFKYPKILETFQDPEILETFEDLMTNENLELIEVFTTSRCFRQKKFNISQLVTDTPTPRDAIASKNFAHN